MVCLDPSPIFCTLTLESKPKVSLGHSFRGPELYCEVAQVTMRFSCVLSVSTEGFDAPPLMFRNMNFIQLCCRTLLENGIECIDATHLSYNTISILLMAHILTWPANGIVTFLSGG